MLGSAGGTAEPVGDAVTPDPAEVREAANHNDNGSEDGKQETKSRLPAANPASPAVDLNPLEPEPDFQVAESDSPTAKPDLPDDESKSPAPTLQFKPLQHEPKAACTSQSRPEDDVACRYGFTHSQTPRLEQNRSVACEKSLEVVWKPLVMAGRTDRNGNDRVERDLEDVRRSYTHAASGGQVELGTRWTDREAPVLCKV